MGDKELWVKTFILSQPKPGIKIKYQCNAMHPCRVGYAGGSTKDPTYYKMGDHTEVVDILYDPKLTSFEVLVESFLVSRDHKKRSSRQYRSIILFHEDQKGILSTI